MSTTSPNDTAMLERFRRTFFDECAEWLEAIERGLASMADGHADQETVHEVFRGVHSIKGGAGAFGMTQLVRFAHAMESLLDRVRSGEIAAERAVVAQLQRSNDHLSDLVSAASAGRQDSLDEDTELLLELQALGAGPASGPGETGRSHPAVPSDASPTTTTWTIGFHPDSSFLRRAGEPLLLLRELARIGSCTVTCDTSGVPGLDALDPDDCHLVWHVSLVGSVDEAAIRELFEFVAEDGEVTITEASSDERDDSMQAPAVDLTRHSDSAQAPSPDPVRPAPSATGSARAARRGSSIRVDLARIDQLVDLVGELVIAQAMVSQQVADTVVEQHAGLALGIAQLAQRTRQLQESVMAVRAQPLQAVFARMPRVVRELCAQLGKQARLEITGEDTEIDRMVVEELAEPLTHMLRNALDHGLETPEVRIAAGKPPEGVIQLSAAQRNGRIVITLRDDGRGIDRARVLAKARAQALVSDGAALSDAEIDGLIFHPGFSTADSVSDVSGRGVGMDVVKRRITELGGRIAIASSPSQGACFTLILPLTLAILDGMVLAVGAERYVVPIASIVESLRPAAQDTRRLPGGVEVLSVRGERLRLVRLGALFALHEAETRPEAAIVVVVENDTGERFGLLVDQLLGQQQCVVKSLEANYGRIGGVSAATILGDGKVALILDVEQLASIDAGPHQPAQPIRAGSSHVH